MLNVRALTEREPKLECLCQLQQYIAYLDTRITIEGEGPHVKVYKYSSDTYVRGLYLAREYTYSDYYRWVGGEPCLYIFCLAHLVLFGDYPDGTVDTVKAICST